jgi:hypothetical protein
LEDGSEKKREERREKREDRRWKLEDRRRKQFIFDIINSTFKSVY